MGLVFNGLRGLKIIYNIYSSVSKLLPQTKVNINKKAVRNSYTISSQCWEWKWTFFCETFKIFRFEI